MKRKVFLVGAGPGDPELLTLKAVRILRGADVVLHDDLVPAQILDLVPAHALLHNVGKRCGKKKITQDDINALMISLAASGLCVVRLKGGDPVIFGRIAEEMAALRSANIDFEIVPGITAALGAACSAKIALTHRASRHALVLIAGHHASDADATDWHALVSSGAAFAIYMPGYKYGEIAAKMRAAGLKGATACEIISRATTPEQQVYSTNVDELKYAPHLPPPTLLIVGGVAGDFAPVCANPLQDTVDWRLLPPPDLTRDAVQEADNEDHDG